MQEDDHDMNRDDNVPTWRAVRVLEYIRLGSSANASLPIV